ncbi:hypothetical protein QOZ80_9AG0690860 [Eleusine coracana subsp. coracana]|nr:hypothetical protein QOZ80_9AG0690860 [Eleusine coracana subsp. coracana]
MAALAEHGSVKTLTIRVEEERYVINKFMFRNCHHRSNNEDVPDIVDDVTYHPACHGVEELHIEAYDSSNPAAGSKHRGLSMPVYYNLGYYDDLSFGSIPSKALRHLDITNCTTLTSPPPDAFFLCLQDLLLQSCGVSLDTLEAMVMASPRLDTLHLDYVYITMQVCYATPADVDNGYLMDDDRDGSILIQSFCCPTVTTLVLLNCRYSGDFTVELDAPRVRRFRYSGKVDVFPLKTPPPDLRQVDLHIFGSQDCTLFWPFLMNFRNTKALKLKLKSPIEDIAVVDKNEYEELLNEMWFGNLERLEVDVKHEPACKGDAAVAIGNLLQCCPALVDLRLNLSIVEDDRPVLRNRKA